MKYDVKTIHEFRSDGGAEPDITVQIEGPFAYMQTGDWEIAFSKQELAQFILVLQEVADEMPEDEESEIPPGDDEAEFEHNEGYTLGYRAAMRQHWDGDEVDDFPSVVDDSARAEGYREGWDAFFEEIEAAREDEEEERRHAERMRNIYA